MHPCVDIMISALLEPQPLAHSRQQNRARHGYDAPLAPELIGWLKELRNSASTARHLCPACPATAFVSSLKAAISRFQLVAHERIDKFCFGMTK